MSSNNPNQGPGGNAANTTNTTTNITMDTTTTTNNINDNNNNNNATRGYVGLFFTGGRRMTRRFVDEEECMSFKRDISVLYMDNAQLNDDVLNHGLSPDGDEFRHRVEHWLGLCTAFANRWGQEWTPDDLRQAWNSFEDFLGRKRTIF
jgi:hypothetical protein